MINRSSVEQQEQHERKTRAELFLLRTGKKPGWRELDEKATKK
jgi:hypothetical protein